LAGEDCSKVSSVLLRPYPISEFDFDHSLHVHLRFDSAVEKESFLVGQEDIIVEETIIQHLDLCNEPGSLTKVMDPNLNQESQKAQISGGELESVVENDKLNVMEAKVDNTFDDVTQMDAKNAENESMDKELLEGPSVTAVENPGSSENVGASIVELRSLENMQQVAVNASGLSEDFSSGAAEHDIQSKQIRIDVPDVKAVQKPSSETSNPFGENPSQMIKSEDSDSQESNVGLMSKLSPTKNYLVDENETTIGKASQPVTSDPSLLSADNLYEMAGDRSIEKDAHAGGSEPGAIHVYQGDSLNKKEDASLPMESSERDVEVVRALDSQMNAEPSLSVEGSKENTTIGHTFASDASVQVEQVAAMESDNKETMENDGILQVKSVVASGLTNPSSIVQNEASTDLVEKVVLGIDVHCVKPVESRNTSQSEQEPESNSGGQECIKRLESPCELSETNGNNSQTRGLHDMVEGEHTIIPLKLHNLRCFPLSVLGPKMYHLVFDCVYTSLAEVAIQNHIPLNSGHHMIMVLSRMYTIHMIALLRVGRPINSIGDACDTFNKTIEHQTSTDVARPSDFKLKGKQEVTKDIRHDIATQEGKNFSFEVDGSAGLAQDGKGFQPYPTFQVSNLPKILDSSSSHLDATKLHEVPHSPQNTSGLTAQTGVKEKAERKPRRKSVKENARKSFSLTSPATVGVPSSAKLPDSNNSTSIFQQPFTDNQQVQLRAQILVYGSMIWLFAFIFAALLASEVEYWVEIQCSISKNEFSIHPSFSSLLTYHSALWQDKEKRELSKSNDSGTPPEEPHMLAAFGNSDGRRIWEGVWHAYLERLHVQKAQAKSNNPLQTRSDLRDAGNKADQGANDASVQTKISSSSIGVTGNKATPPKFSSMIPVSSSLWNMSTPSEYRHPYQTPPVQQSFSAHYNPSWLSQGPFTGQWLPPYNTTPTFPAFPVTEAVKLTPVNGLAGSGKKPTSTPTVLNSASTIFPEASSGDFESRKSSPVVSNPFSTSDALTVPALIISKNIPAKFLSAVSPIHDPNKVKVVISKETLIKVEESKLQSEDATKHAAVAVNHCHSVWSQLETQNNLALSSDNEAKLVSSAVAIAAAASVSKVAAAAAKIASDFAEHARSMVNGASLSSSKHAENLNAVVKAAELAAEAVSQAGKIVAMSEPMPLLDLVKAGSEGYWKTPRLASKQQPNLNGNDKKIVESAPEVSEKEILNTKSGLSRNENIEYVPVEGTSLPFTTHEKSKRKPRVRKGRHLAKTIGVAPELEIGSINTSIGQAHPKASTGLKENIIEEGCLVEVYKDGDTYDGAWFGANVLSVKDGKALVCYTDIQSEEGSGQLKEWVPLEVGTAEVPKIRSPHPVTTRRLEGTRKRSWATSTDYVWSSGDLVDVWIQDRWREGVITEINKMDVTSLTINFPAQGVTSLVRSWFVRPTLIWKDGKWVDSHTSEKHFSSQEDRPQEKRLKLGSPIVESKTNETSSENIDLVDPQKQEEPKTLSLSTHESVFNIGTTKDNKKVTAQRTIRSGLQKEGPRVIFGVPKPGKKQKFMDIGSSLANKNNRSHDSVKFTKYLIPQAPGSRGWKNSSRDPKEKQATGIKPTMMSRKPPVPSRPFTSSKSTIVDTNTINETNPDCVIDGENQSGHQNTDIEIEPRHEDLISSLANSQPPKGEYTSSTRSDRSKKQKFVPTVEKSAKIEKTLPEVVETRRSRRKIQPTSKVSH
ncbi:agenet domain-containing protein, partial [Tanacetum coccineum]